ncbi:MAG: hypothetical protein L6437_04040 [Kiritimatiellae bacterium]|nr:hypothetical protein [Verrucomicrobiota bacterium]MBU4286193.1 hypothetical protein [Verrucomicrobiota bacterium]MBU4366985.1 hypothetical protein [Verrucomicrobiota bacterium]MCG2659401.1 hypothetical protein [Kiritimatiellia bacterium]
MTSRERLELTMRCGQADRVPAKPPPLPPAAPATAEQRRRFAAAFDAINDTMASWGLEGDTGFFYTVHPDFHYREYRRPASHEGYEELVQELAVPAGRLTGIELNSPVGLPAYQQQYMISRPEDVDILLSIPCEPPRPSPQAFFDKVAALGDKGVVIVGMVDVVYNVYRLLGSERFALWSADQRELLHAMCEFFCRRQCDAIKYCLSQGMGPCFGWVGPEICVPPLMGPRDFDDFVVRYDRRLTDIIHEAGGVVWVHSHGSVSKVLEGFVAAGVDCLQPLEPPPYGDLILADAKRRVRGRICLEGNFECYEFDKLSPEAMRERVRQAIQDAAPGGGFIVASADSPTQPMTPQSVAALLAFVEAVRDYGKY